MNEFARVTAVGSLIAAATLTIHAQRPTTDWTQWRGPNRDGAATTFMAPAAWPEALVQKWTVEVGTGYASPIVVGDRLYMFSRRGDNEGMSAHDVATGRELWRFGYDAPFTMHSAASKHNQGPKATPVYTNGTLLTIGMTGVVTAWDAATGKTRWQKPGSTPVPLYTSHSFSPVVDGNTVIFHLGGHDKGALTAFDVTTGAQKWSWGGDGPGYGSPIIATIGGTRQVVTITQTKIVGVDFASGALLWERPYASQLSTNSTTPLLDGQTIIVSGNGGPTVAFTANKAGNAWTTTTVWENDDTPLKLTNMVLSNNILFGITTKNSGQYFAVDARTGKTLWLSPGRQATQGAIAKAGNYFLSLQDNGELVVVRSNPTSFELLKKYKLAQGETWSEAVFSGNRIFIKDLNSLSLWTLS